MESVDKIFSASSRFKPYETIFFTPALVGPNGVKLISYTWFYEWTMEPNWEGELVSKRISDWTQAEKSSETGRNIVHQYTIEQPDKTIKHVSSETVPIVLGLVDKIQVKLFGNLATASKTLAKQQMKLAVLEAKNKEFEDLRKKFENTPKPKIEKAQIKELPLIAQRIYKDELDEPKGVSFTYFKMGDVLFRQDNTYNYSEGKYIITQTPDSHTARQLEYMWIDERVKENGGQRTPELRELKNRVDRQKKKVEQFLKTEKYEKGGLLAPNGAKSNLTPEQYKLVRTPEFKAWFGDWENSPKTSSKVVDENGEPLVVYHGSGTKNIESFDSEKSGSIQYSDWGKGIYFTPRKSTADYYSNEAIIKNDKLYNELYEIFERTQSNDDLKNFQKRGRELSDNKETIVYPVFLNMRKPLKEVVESMNYTDPFLSRTAIEKKNDGIIILNGRFKFDELLVFNSTQIKLADGSNTTFDGSNADIRYKQGGELLKRADGNYSKRGLWDNIRDNEGSGKKPTKQMLEQEAKIKAESMRDGGLIAPNGAKSNLNAEQYKLVRTPEFKAWFGDWENSPETSSKVVDENGEPLVVYHGTKNTFSVFTQNKFIYTSDSLDYQMKLFTSKSDRIFQLFGKSKKILDLTEFGAYEIDIEKLYKFFKDKSINFTATTFRKIYGYFTFGEITIESLIKAGYDGVYLVFESKYNSRIGESEKIDYKGYIFISPNQIKLADGSNTTFDGSNEDIRYKQGGELLKRADGNYSKRGLWDNIRDNEGSGKKPTKQMLEQEAKIKAESMRDGGLIAQNGGLTTGLKYYNSHGFSMPWTEMVQIEIGRGNYTKREFNNWAKKYNIKPNDNVIWVTSNKNIAVSYTAPSSDYEKILSMSDSQLDNYIISQGINLNEYTQKDGNLINESDDGDDGYILLLSKKYEKGGLIAPNGSKSNLTPEQYKLVRTPEFKAWFGDWENSPETSSKVVDENGEPLVVYHGSDNEFFVFNPDLTGYSSGAKRTRRGVYFSSKKNVAETFIHKYKKDKYGWDIKDGFIYEVFLNLRFPNIIDGQGKNILWWDRDIRDIEWSEVKFKDNAEKGFIIKNTIDTIGELVEYSDIYIAYNPHQIKLADGSNTTFDSGNPDIRYAEGGEIDVENEVQKPILEKFDEQTIATIQSLRHKLHSIDVDDIFHGTENFDDYIEKIADEIKQLNITGKEKGIASSIIKFNQSEGGDRKFYGGEEYEDKEIDTEDYYFLAYREISAEKEAINNIVEDYLQSLDEVWDNYELSKISDIRGYKKTFAPSGYLRARSLLGTGQENTSTAKTFESKLDKFVTEFLSKKYEKGGYTERAKGPLEKELDNKLATLKTKDEQLRKQYFNLKLDLGKKAVKVSQVDLFGTQKVGKLFDDTVSLTEAENVARKLLKEADTEIVKNRAEINRLEKSRDEIIKADSNQISMFAKGGKTEAINKKGDCYEITGNVAMSNSKTIGSHYFKGTPYIVHAEVTGQGAIKDIRYGHAWIEDDINVYEYSNGNEITIPIELYYKWGKVNRSPNKYYKYTFNDAINKMLDTQHYGPWDLKTESGL